VRIVPALLIGWAAAASGQALAADPLRTCSSEALAADIEACDSTIAAEQDAGIKSRLLVRRAYAFNERRKYEAALKDLNLALEIAPDLTDALHERGYTLVELGEFTAAKRDLDSAVARRPENPSAHSERALILRGTGDFAEAYAERDRVVALRPGEAGPLLGRGEAALWLGRFQDASDDAERANALAGKAADAETLAQAQDLAARVRLWSGRISGGSAADRCNEAGSAGNFGTANLIGDCTAAFLAGRTGAEKANALAYRSLAWRLGRKDPGAAATDREVAIALDPLNADWLFNLGYSYYELRRYEAAIRLFDRSLALQETAAALSGRAGARFYLGDKAGARADARRAISIKPYPLAFLVLGDLANEAEDRDSAKTYWLKAYQAGWRGDRLQAQLKSVGVEHPESEPQR
jgi:tetratricopeptide (TPR) repeat protein